MCQKYQGAIKKQQCKLKYGEILKLKKNLVYLMLHFVMVFTNQKMTLRSKSSKMYTGTSSVFDDSLYISCVVLFSTFYMYYG